MTYEVLFAHRRDHFVESVEIDCAVAKDIRSDNHVARPGVNVGLCIARIQPACYEFSVSALL